MTGEFQGGVPCIDGTFLPSLTFATPGDLAVAYTTRVGVYTKIGKLVIAHVRLLLSTFTFTTASGNAQITGLPFVSQQDANLMAWGGGVFAGITKASYTYFCAQVGPNTNIAALFGGGSGQAVAQLTAADIPSAGAPDIRFTLAYNAQ